MPETNPFLKLLATPELAGLGPGPRQGVQPEPALESALETIFQQSQTPAEGRQLILALVLLWHDHLEPAHLIAQSIENPDGAFVHGIMHRREPDYGNAAYWFRRVGAHSAFRGIGSAVGNLLKAKADMGLQSELVPQGRWDPFGFIQACEAAGTSKGKEQVQILQEIQRIETETLLVHFTRG